MTPTPEDLIPSMRRSYKPWLVAAVLMLCDLAAIFMAFFLASGLRSGWPFSAVRLNFASVSLDFWMVAVLIIGLFTISGLYPGSRRTGLTEMQEIIRLVTISFIILGLVIYFLHYTNPISRAIFLIAWPLSCFFLTFFRLLAHNRGSLASWWSQPVLMVGYRKDVEEVNAKLSRARRLALKPIVALTLDENELEARIDGIPYYPYSIDRQEQIWRQGIKQVVFVSSSFGINSIHNKYLHLLSLTYSNLIYVMGESPLSSISIKPVDIIGQPALQVRYNLLDRWSIALKRVIELAICLAGLLVVFPLFLFFAFLIRLDSPGPILFRQKRMGKGGRIIELLKFRTMEVDAEIRLQKILAEDPCKAEEYQKFHKLRNDPRITGIGRFLRKTSLDEFPQIWNVLRGDISLVGPRAYLEREKQQMGDSINLIQRVNPGLTGWWQVMGRHELTFQERLKLDEFYITNFSVWMDLYILAKTFWVVLSLKGE